MKYRIKFDRLSSEALPELCVYCAVWLFSLTCISSEAQQVDPVVPGTGKTAAEIIISRADSQKPFMC